MSESFIDLKCNKSCRHIRELEQQLSELKESQKQKQITRLCNRLDKAEQQKAELIKTLNNWLISFKSTLRKQEYQVETFNILNDRYIESAELLKKHGVEL